MTLFDRITDRVHDFMQRHPGVEGVDNITMCFIDLSRRGRGPGNSLYVATAAGIGFEVELLPGDDVAGVMAQVACVH